MTAGPRGADGRPWAHSFGQIRPYPSMSSVPELIEAWAERTPGKSALRFGEDCSTYRELVGRARALAHLLRQRGVEQGDVVAVLGHPSARLIVTMLGILYAGAAYLPLDPASPAARHRSILAEAGEPLLIADEELGEQGHSPAVPLQQVYRDAESFTGDAAVARPGSADLAYVTPTSGSTGTPKLVMVSHRAVVRLVVNTDYIALSPEDVVAFASNIAFDAATFEIWGALLNGATVDSVDRETLLSSYLLGPHLRARGITTMFLTTALLRMHAKLAPATFNSLGHLLTGGEVMYPDTLRAVLRAGGPRRLLHAYGPTEATTFSTMGLVAAVLPEADSVPIGGPIANSNAYVLDPDGWPVDVGEVGELYIGGHGVARGYLGRPEQTEQVFSDDPWVPGGRMYRSGDFVRWTPNGQLDFVGRRDDQVKLRGFRIELPEVESAVRSLPSVREAAVVIRGEGDAKTLVAYVVATGPGEQDRQIEQALAALLPPQMVPSVIQVDRLLLTSSGKVDRIRLRNGIESDTTGTARR
jgi:amino acid adenylation domain-containing protein